MVCPDSANHHNTLLPKSENLLAVTSEENNLEKGKKYPSGRLTGLFLASTGLDRRSFRYRANRSLHRLSGILPSRAPFASYCPKDEGTLTQQSQEVNGNFTEN